MTDGADNAQYIFPVSLVTKRRDTALQQAKAGCTNRLKQAAQAVVDFTFWTNTGPLQSPIIKHARCAGAGRVQMCH